MIQITKTDALIIIDPQIDFCPGGALAVAGGAEIMAGINDLTFEFRSAKKGPIILTQDWHPKTHKSFASNHEGKEPYSTTEMPYGTQTLWPDHCVNGTPGAEFHPEIDVSVTRAHAIIRKGMNPEIDSYSAFYENDNRTPTGLGGYLKELGVTRVFIVGLAYDFCVGFSAIDAAELEGLEAFVIKDVTRAIDLNGSVAAIEEKFARAQVKTINEADLVF